MTNRVLIYFFAILLVCTSVVSCHKTDSNTSPTPTFVPDFDILISGNLTVGQSEHVYSTLPESTAYNYSWDLGDGTTSTNQDCSIIYKLSKTYTVTLTVNNDTAHRKRKTIFIGPDYSFSWAGVPLPGDSISFRLIYGILPGCTYLWQFGDGSTATDSFPYHKFADTGAFLVSLTVNNDTAHTARSVVRILQDPLYTLLVQGTRLWHGTEIQTYGSSPITLILPDTTFGITYLNPVGISVWNQKLLYNPDSSSANTLFFGLHNLNVVYNYATNTFKIHSKWHNTFPDYTGPGHHPEADIDDVWVSP